MGKLKAVEKLERLLAMIPWIMSNDGPTLESIAQRFEYPEPLLLDDLTKVLFMVGPYPHTPDTLIEVLVEDGRVWIDQADWLARPIRLTPEQGFLVLRKAKTLAIIQGKNDSYALNSAIEKLEKCLGQSGDTFDLDIAEFQNQDLSEINKSIETGTQLRIRYYAYSKDESTTRTVHPIEIVNRDHSHYLHAYCNTARDYRLFRLDRILEARGTSKINNLPDEEAESILNGEKWDLESEGSPVTLVISQEDSWILSTYPIQNYSSTDDGGFEVELIVTGIAWLKRLLLRLSPNTKILKSPDYIPADLAKQTAIAITDRYKQNL